MDSSRGFGSHRRYKYRALHTRFPCGSPPLPEVNQATPMHSPDHSTKGTPSALGGTLPQWPLTAGEYVVSGSVSSPSRGAFHLSLTVLVHYRSLKIFSLGGWSPQLPTNSPWFVVLRMPAGQTWMVSTRLSRALAGLSNPFECPLFVVVLVLQPRMFLKNPRFGLVPFRSPLLWESRLISARRATEMFQFTHCPPSLPMCSAGGRQTSLWRGCPIRILKAHRLYAAPLERFAGLRVLLRSLAPRHPPRTLCSLFSSMSACLYVCVSVEVLRLPDTLYWYLV
jgi:hypothetical protein